MQATATIDETGDLTISGITAAVPWWSFTKTVLAAAVLRLADLGVMALDGRVGGHRFTIRQLLRHEAGLPDYGSLSRYHDDVAAGKAPWPVPKMLAAVEADRLRFDPGKGWAYSNVGYLIVAQVIAMIADRPLAAALASLVFEPAGLATARLASRPADLRGVQMGSASAYDPGWVYHGLVVGSVADAARLLHALLKGDLLKPNTLAAMLEGRSLPEYGRETHPDPAYGLGVMLSAGDTRSHPIGHTGEGPGSRIAVYAQGDRAAAVWTALPAIGDAEAAANHLLVA